jgi:hypothetical protein
MTTFEAIRRMTNRDLKLAHLLNFSNLISTASRERYKEIRKRGRKLMKYFELTK